MNEEKPKEKNYNLVYVLFIAIVLVMMIIGLIIFKDNCEYEIELEPGVNYILRGEDGTVGILNIQHNLLSLTNQNIQAWFIEEIAPTMNVTVGDIIEVIVVGEEIKINNANITVKFQESKKICLDKYGED